MTDAPSTRFVDGLRVTPAHLNHLHSVAGGAIADLRRLVGRDRVALGFRLMADGAAVVLTPGLGFTRSGLPVRRDEPVVVPESLEPVRARAPRSVVFDDTDDELDVPDFLK